MRRKPPPTDQIPTLADSFEFIRLAHNQTREEAARHIGISVSLLDKLGQGTRPQPTRDTIAKAVRAFNLPHVQHRYLNELAAPSAPLKPAEELRRCLTNADVQTHLDSLDDYDILAVYLDPLRTVLHGNRTFHRSVPGLDEADYNYIQWMFSRHARRIIVDWESEARLAVAILRAVLGRYRNLPRARRLFHTLMSNPDFARIWRATPMHVAYGRDYPAPIRVHTPHSDEPQPCHLTLTDYDGCDNIVVAYGTHNAPALTG